ncbi:MAG: DUF1587 domain-containing protein [Limisphaerales bacterium]
MLSLLATPFLLLAQPKRMEVSQPVQEFMRSTCFRCHGSDKQKGDVRLDTLSPSLGDPAGAQLWQDVLDIINLGDMPPDDAKQPDQEQLAEAIGLLTEDLLKARKRLADKGGEVVIRRLTELEYINTIHSLTGVHLPADLVPDDESGVDFNTLGHYQTFSPAMLEQYEAAARYAVEQMLQPTPKREPKTVRVDERKHKLRMKERELKKHEEAHARAKKVPVGTTDFRPYGFRNDAEYKQALKVSPQFYIPLLRHYLANTNTRSGVVLYQAAMGPLVTGTAFEAEPGAEYIFRARVGAEPGMPTKAKVLRLGSFQPGKGKQTLRYFHIHGTAEEPEVIETRVRTKPGVFSLQLGFSDLFRARKANTTAIQQGKTVPGYWVDWVEFEGPFFSGNQELKRRKLFDGDKLDEAKVLPVLDSFARRAFRGKPVDEAFLNQLNTVYREERIAGKSATDALIMPLTMILSAPDMLYLGKEKFATRLT